MSNVPGVIPSAAAGVPLIPTKRTRLEYSTVAKTGYIDPATKNDYSQKNKKITKNTKKFKKFQQNDKNNVKKITSPPYNLQKYTEFSGDIDAAIDHVALSIGNTYVSYQYDSMTKVLYFMLYNKESAKKSINTPIEYNEVVVELYQTVTLEEGTQIIKITNTNSANI
ncbi:hypothetical protein BB561_006095 [Smittium simulii]|uniref:Uncharacterized protein n=1 Tax=Smittium simulii TaxID=133385 RepID=A0A2T9Y6N9_9FUNG|nr:hypothetical protein BB561_006095 [Smittium simulii]